MKKFLTSAENIVANATRILASICLFIVFALFILNVFLRFFPIVNAMWIDETIQFFLVWMIFLAAMELVRVGEHFLVDIVTSKLEGKTLGRILAFVCAVLTFLTVAAICYSGFNLCQRATTPMVTLRFMKQNYYYFCVPFSAVFMCIYTLRDIVCTFKNMIRPSAENV